MKKIISIICLSIMVLFSSVGCSSKENADIVIFTQTGCGHCSNAMDYINSVLIKDIPTLKVVEYNIRESDKNYQLFLRYVQKYAAGAKQVGTPFIVVDGEALIGWTEENQQILTNRLHKQN